MIIGKQNYIVEDSNIYINLPISFTKTPYIVEINDGGGACASFGANTISASKIQIFNVGFNGKSINEFNTPGYGGFLFAIGF